MQGMWESAIFIGGASFFDISTTFKWCWQELF